MALFNKLVSMLGFRRREASILVVGLDSSGKTSIMNNLKPVEEKTTEIVPTVGFNVERFRVKNIQFTAFDMSGQGRYRNLWEHHFKGVSGIIFVIDSSDQLRLVVAKDELDMMLSHSDIEPRVPILFFSNKMDLRDSQPVAAIASTLGLDQIRDRPWHIQPSNAISGEGLQDGVDWLAHHIILASEGATPGGGPPGGPPQQQGNGDMPSGHNPNRRSSGQSKAARKMSTGNAPR